MHKNRKRRLKKGEKSSKMEIRPGKNNIRYQEVRKQDPHYQVGIYI
jgi:hypothetical protein